MNAVIKEELIHGLVKCIKEQEFKNVYHVVCSITSSIDNNSVKGIESVEGRVSVD